MSTFTMPLWKVIEFTGGSSSVNEDGVRIMEGGDIGLNYFTTHNPEHKPELVGKIIDHYWNQEIAHETVSIFQLAMRRKMNEIMPYYNKLYETEDLQFDPISTMKIQTLGKNKEIQNVGVESEGTSVATNHSGSRTVQSELPQTMLAGNADYATAGVDANTTTDGTTTATDSKTSDSTTDTDTDTLVEGYQAYPSQLLQQYRAAILNIDMMIISDLSECFMGIWNNNDTYDPRGDYPYRLTIFG